MQHKLNHYLLFATIIYLSIAIFSLNKPLTMDQAMPTAENAGAIAAYGWDALGDVQRGYEIAHPTLYHHILALSYKIFGETTIAGRLVGVFFFLGVLFMIIRLSIQLFPERKGVIIGGTAALLYAINPFAVQQSLLLDQETTILPLTLLIFVYYLYRNDFSTSWKSIISLGMLFALCIWAKELSPFFMLIALLPFVWLYRGFRDAIILTAGIGIMGLVLFLASWGLYCVLTGVPVLSFIEFSIINKAMNPAFHEGRSFTKLVKAFVELYKMVTPALMVFLGLAAINRIRVLFKNGLHVQSTDYIWIYIVVIFSITNLHMYSHPRYQYPMYSFAVILIAEYFYGLLTGAVQKNIVTVIGLGTGIAIILAIVLPDTHLISSYKYAVVWVIVPFVVCCLAVFIFTRTRILSRQYWGLAAMCILIATNLSVGIQQCKSYTTAVSWHEYGEEGFSETLEYLRNNVGNTIPIIRKDFAYYLTIDQPDRNFSWIYTNIFRGAINEKTIEEINQTIMRDDIKYIVLDRYTNMIKAGKLISPHYTLVKKYGDFEIYKRKRDDDASDSDKPITLIRSIFPEVAWLQCQLKSGFSHACVHSYQEIS